VTIWHVRTLAIPSDSATSRPRMTGLAGGNQ
jgi:hypothetical protein